MLLRQIASLFLKEQDAIRDECVQWQHVYFADSGFVIFFPGDRKEAQFTLAGIQKYQVSWVMKWGA